jgi:hypothetical protein
MRAGSDRTGFRFYDDQGIELGVGAGVATDRVARVRVSVMAGGVGAAQGVPARRDSVDVTLQRAGAP